MLFFTKYGVGSVSIDIGEYMVYCPCCEGHCVADTMVISNYYHFLQIPVFPIGKEANLACQTCGLKRYGAGYNSKTFANFEQIKHLYKHPWFTYIGVGFASIFPLLAIYFALVRSLTK